MKKLMMTLVAVIVTGVSYTRAEDVKLSFDGETEQAICFGGLMKISPVFETGFPVPVATTDATNRGAVLLYEVEKADRQMMRQAILNTSAKLFDKNSLLIIDDEKTSILYNRSRVLFINNMDGNRYNILLESDDSRLINLFLELNKQSAQHLKIHTDEQLAPCLEWGTQEVCANKYVCALVCSTMGPLGCLLRETVCEWIPKCYDQRVCLRT